MFLWISGVTVSIFRVIFEGAGKLGRSKVGLGKLGLGKPGFGKVGQWFRAGR